MVGDEDCFFFRYHASCIGSTDFAYNNLAAFPLCVAGRNTNLMSDPRHSLDEFPNRLIVWLMRFVLQYTLAARMRHN